MRTRKDIDFKTKKQIAISKWLIDIVLLSVFMDAVILILSPLLKYIHMQMPLFNQTFLMVAIPTVIVALKLPWLFADIRKIELESLEPEFVSQASIHNYAEEKINGLKDAGLVKDNMRLNCSNLQFVKYCIDNHIVRSGRKNDWDWATCLKNSRGEKLTEKTLAQCYQDLVKTGKL